MPRNKGFGYARKAPKRKKRKAPPPVSDDETEHVPGSSMTQEELDWEAEDQLDCDAAGLMEEALRDAREDQHECRRRFCKYAAQTIACAHAPCRGVLHSHPAPLRTVKVPQRACLHSPKAMQDC